MFRTTRATSILNTLAGAALVGLLAMPAPQPAFAQDALGGGNALDGNLSSEGPINPTARQEDYRVRNLLVTGNVPGGRGFRESVGYTAAGDFRESIGSDDLFSFRAGSAFSAPAFVNYGRTYEQLRFGYSLGALEYSRDFQGATLRDVQEPSQPVTGELIDARLRLDRISRSSQSLGAYEVSPAGDLVGVTYGEDGRVLVARASSLTGISTVPADTDVQQIGLTPYDMARIREQSQTGQDPSLPVVGKPFEPAFEAAFDPYKRQDERPVPESKITPETIGERIESGVQAERIESVEPSQRLETGQQTSYRDVLRRVVERYAGDENVQLNMDPQLLKELQQEYDDLRQTLRGTADQQIPRITPGADAADESGLIEPVDSGEAAVPMPSNGEGPEISDIDQLAGALRHGQRVTKLSAEEQTRFNELVAQAELALRQGEFFLAERRFDRALRFSPGHPLATAGMGHAQIGSGLYLSAALTLRTLLTNNPEMIDVRYDDALIPARGRLESAITTIRERIGKQQDVALNSFLLAYIGRLLDDEGIMTEGLDGLARALPDDSLEKLIRAVWLGEDDDEQPQK